MLVSWLSARRVRLGAVTPVLVCLLATVGCSKPDPAVIKADALRRGDELVAKERFKEAVGAYREAVAADDNDGEARLKLAQAAEKSQQWDEVGRQYVRAADLLPDRRDVQVTAIRWLLGMGRPIDAADRATKLLAQTPEDPELLVYLGNAKAKVPSSVHAIATLDEAMRQGRNFDGARAHVRSAFKPSVPEDREAEELYRHALRVAPAQPDARLALAGLLWLVGRGDDGADLVKEAADASPADVFLSRALGLYYEFRGRYSEAEKYLRAAAKEPVSQLALADFLTRRDRLAEALPLLERLAAGDDRDSGAALRTAEVEFRSGRRDQALARVEKILAREAGHPRALQLKARALFATKEYAQAITTARTAIVGDPNALGARLVLAQSLEATGDRESAFNEFGALWRLNTSDAGVATALAGLALELGRNNEALEMATQAVRLAPANREAAIKLATAQVRTGDFATADRTLAPLLAGHTNDPDLLVLQAAIQAGRGNVDAARSSYLRVLQSNPDSLDALTGLLAIETRAGKVAGLRPRIEQAAGRHPKDLAYQLLVARAARAAGDAAAAQTALTAILAKDAGHVEGALMSAAILAEQHRPEEARQTLEKALLKQPNTFGLQVALASLLETMGRPAEARTLYETILATNQDAYEVSARLAALYADQGDNLDIALKLAQTAKRNLPNDPAVADTLGWIYVKKRLNSSSLPYLQEAVKAQPSNALFRYHLGVAYESLAELTKARDELSRALALDPNFSGAADARKLLAAIGK